MSVLCNEQITMVPIQFLKHIEHFSAKRVNWLMAKIQREKMWTKPICVDKTHYLVMDGQHRLEVAKKIGIRHVPCLLFDYERVEIWSLRANYHVDHDTVINRALTGDIYPYKTVKHRFPEEIKSLKIHLSDLL